MFYLIGECFARSISVFVVLYSDLSAGFWCCGRWVSFLSVGFYVSVGFRRFSVGCLFFPLRTLLSVGFWVWTVLPWCCFPLVLWSNILAFCPFGFCSLDRG